MDIQINFITSLKIVVAFIVLIASGCKKDKKDKEENEPGLTVDKWTNLGDVEVSGWHNYGVQIFSQENFTLTTAVGVYVYSKGKGLELKNPSSEDKELFSSAYSFSVNDLPVFPSNLAGNIPDLEEYETDKVGIFKRYTGTIFFKDTDDGVFCRYHSCHTSFYSSQPMRIGTVFLRSKHDKFLINEMYQDTFGYREINRVTIKDKSIPYYEVVDIFRVDDGYLLYNAQNGHQPENFPPLFVAKDGSYIKLTQYYNGRITALNSGKVVYSDDNGIYKYEQGGKFSNTPFYDGPLIIRSSSIDRFDRLALGYDYKNKRIVYINTEGLSVIKTVNDDLGNLFDGYQTKNYPYIYKSDNLLFFLKYGKVYARLEK